MIAERFIKTLKGKIYKKITANDSKSYLPYLNKLVDQYNNTHHHSINPIQDRLVWGSSRMERSKSPPPHPPLPEICQTYPAMIKLATVIPYPRKIQKLYKSPDTPLDFCWHHHFYTRNQQISLYQKIQM